MISLFFSIFGIIGVMFVALKMHNITILALMQPSEWLVVVGMGAISFILSNPSRMRKNILLYLKKALFGKMCTKDDYKSLLHFMLVFTRYCKSTKAQELDAHLDAPNDSYLFQSCKMLLHNNRYINFICDYFRMISMDIGNSQAIIRSMDADILEQYNIGEDAADAVSKLGDALPGIGIVAAVLGVIIAMSAIDSGPAGLAAAIGAALVGTLIGVLLCYTVLYPISSLMSKVNSNEIAVLRSLKACIEAYLQLLPPTIIIEIVRNQMPSDIRPTFHEVEIYNERHKYSGDASAANHS